jgi:hypothetical protein
VKSIAEVSAMEGTQSRLAMINGWELAESGP